MRTTSSSMPTPGLSHCEASHTDRNTHDLPSSPALQHVINNSYQSFLLGQSNNIFNQVNLRFPLVSNRLKCHNKFGKTILGKY